MLLMLGVPPGNSNQYLYSSDRYLVETEIFPNSAPAVGKGITFKPKKHMEEP